MIHFRYNGSFVHCQACLVVPLECIFDLQTKHYMCFYGCFHHVNIVLHVQISELLAALAIPFATLFQAVWETVSKEYLLLLFGATIELCSYRWERQMSL